MQKAGSRVLNLNIFIGYSFNALVTVSRYPVRVQVSHRATLLSSLRVMDAFFQALLTRKLDAEIHLYKVMLFVNAVSLT